MHGGGLLVPMGCRQLARVDRAEWSECRVRWRGLRAGAPARSARSPVVDEGAVDPAALADPMLEEADVAVAEDVALVPPLGDDEVVPPEEDESVKHDLKAEANSVAHLLTRWPKNQHCESCHILRQHRGSPLVGALG